MNKLDFIPFGAQYYRAPTPMKQDWERDLAGFAAHSFNTVKLWAQWVSNNPREGVYDFCDTDCLMDICEKNKLKVIINIVYDGAPPWFFKKYPESVMVTNNGEKLTPVSLSHRQMGGAPGPCYHHKAGIESRRAFTRACVARYKDHPALLCWDLWNEPELTCSIKRAIKMDNLVCYCDESIADFKKYLAHKYVDIEALNAVWGKNYTIFDEVIAPKNGSMFKEMVDWRTFMNDTLVNELTMRLEAARSQDNVHPMMVHTVTAPYFPLATTGSDDYKLAKGCDIFGNSVGSEPLAASISLSAAAGKTVINSEIHAMYGETYKHPPMLSYADMKRHILKPLSIGIRGFVFWQYRPERLGLESPAWGLTNLAGKDTDTLKYAAKINHALQAHSTSLADSSPLPAKVAIINSQRSQLFDFCNSLEKELYSQSVIGAFEMLRKLGYTIDLLGDIQMNGGCLQKYSAIYDPFPYYKNAADCEVIKAWIKDGGLYISEALNGGYSDDTGLHATNIPSNGMEKVFGVTQKLSTMATHYNKAIEHTINKNTVDMAGENGTYKGYFLCEQYEMIDDGVTIIARYTDQNAAIVSNRYGKGTAVAIGSLFAYAYLHCDSSSNIELLASLLINADIKPYFDCKNGRVDLINAVDSKQFLIVHNTSDQGTLSINDPDQLIKGTLMQSMLGGEDPIKTNHEVIITLAPDDMDIYLCV